MVGSSESLHSAQILSSESGYSHGQSVIRGDSFCSERGVPVTSSAVDDSETAAARKSKSLDMGKAVAASTEVDETAAQRNRSRSCVPRLRDIKRKHKKQRQSPPRGRHRLWHSKESLPSAQIEEGIELEEPTMVSQQQEQCKASTISLSLPSLHLGFKNKDGTTSPGHQSAEQGTRENIRKGSGDSGDSNGRGVNSQSTSSAKSSPSELRPPPHPGRSQGSDNGVSGKVYPAKVDSSPTKFKHKKGDTQEHLV